MRKQLAKPIVAVLLLCLVTPLSGMGRRRVDLRSTGSYADKPPLSSKGPVATRNPLQMSEANPAGFARAYETDPRAGQVHEPVSQGDIHAGFALPVVEKTLVSWQRPGQEVVLESHEDAARRLVAAAPGIGRSLHLKPGQKAAHAEALARMLGNMRTADQLKLVEDPSQMAQLEALLQALPVGEAPAFRKTMIFLQAHAADVAHIKRGTGTDAFAEAQRAMQPAPAAKPLPRPASELISATKSKVLSPAQLEAHHQRIMQQNAIPKFGEGHLAARDKRTPTPMPELVAEVGALKAASATRAQPILFSKVTAENCDAAADNLWTSLFQRSGAPSEDGVTRWLGLNEVPFVAQEGEVKQLADVCGVLAATAATRSVEANEAVAERLAKVISLLSVGIPEEGPVFDVLNERAPQLLAGIRALDAALPAESQRADVAINAMADFRAALKNLSADRSWVPPAVEPVAPAKRIRADPVGLPKEAPSASTKRLVLDAEVPRPLRVAAPAPEGRLAVMPAEAPRVAASGALVAVRPGGKSVAIDAGDLKILGLDPAAFFARVAKGEGESALTEAYRRMAKQDHPDKGGATDQFQRLGQVYEALRTALQGAPAREGVRSQLEGAAQLTLGDQAQDAVSLPAAPSSSGQPGRARSKSLPGVAAGNRKDKEVRTPAGVLMKASGAVPVSVRAPTREASVAQASPADATAAVAPVDAGASKAPAKRKSWLVRTAGKVKRFFMSAEAHKEALTLEKLKSQHPNDQKALRAEQLAMQKRVDAKKALAQKVKDAATRARNKLVAVPAAVRPKKQQLPGIAKSEKMTDAVNP